MPETKLAYGRAQLDRTKLAANEPLTFVASSEGLNRHGFSLRAEGWRLDNYNANPVVLWMHDAWMPPIAQGRAVSKNGQVLLEAVTFDQEDELARAVESKYRRGFLSAVSVGFSFAEEDGEPLLDWWRLSGEKIRDELFYDLEEVSAVTVPADPRAVIKNSRLALAKLGRELVDLFDEQEHPEGTVTADQLAAAVKAELERLGVAVPELTTPPETPVDGIDKDAAAAVLAAFPTMKGTP